jgi:hypothetical protein
VIILCDGAGERPVREDHPTYVTRAFGPRFWW